MQPFVVLLFGKCSIRLHKNVTKLSKVEALAMKAALMTDEPLLEHSPINVRSSSEKSI